MRGKKEWNGGRERFLQRGREASLKNFAGSGPFGICRKELHRFSPFAWGGHREEESIFCDHNATIYYPLSAATFKTWRGRRGVLYDLRPWAARPWAKVTMVIRVGSPRASRRLIYQILPSYTPMEGVETYLNLNDKWKIRIFNRSPLSYAPLGINRLFRSNFMGVNLVQKRIRSGCEHNDLFCNRYRHPAVIYQAMAVLLSVLGSRDDEKMY